jgi:hypothetical protein
LADMSSGGTCLLNSRRNLARRNASKMFIGHLVSAAVILSALSLIGFAVWRYTLPV